VVSGREPAGVRVAGDCFARELQKAVPILDPQLIGRMGS